MDRATRERLKAKAAVASSKPHPEPPDSPPEPRTEIRKAMSILFDNPAKKAKPEAAPLRGRPCDVIPDLGSGFGVCCCCAQPIVNDQLVQQTKKAKWRHVTCPPRPPKAPKVNKPPESHDQEMEAKGRLPDGATFHVTYHAEFESWSGMLAIGCARFNGEACGVFKLLSKLDRQFRQSLWKKEMP